MLYNQEWYIWKVSQPLTQGKEQCLLCVFIYSRKKKEGLQRWFHELLNIITTTRKPSVVVQWVSHVQISVTPWTTARQVSLPFTISQSLFKLMSMELMMPSNHLTHCRPLLFPPSIFPSSKVFSKESVLHIRSQSIGVSASASVLPMNIQDWFPFGLTGWIPTLLGVLENTFLLSCQHTPNTALS